MAQPGIFFEAPEAYELPGTDNYWNAMVRDICRALTAAGEPCAPFDLDLQGKQGKTVSFDASALPPFMLTLNFKAGVNFNSSLWIEHKGEKLPMTSVLPVKHITLLLDHPFHCLETIEETRQLDDRMGRPATKLGVMDDGHVRYLEAVGLPREDIFRWPQAGPDPQPVPGQRNRDIGAAFHGTVNDAEPFDAFCQRLSVKGSGVNMVRNCIDSIMEEPIDVYDAVVRHITTPAGIDPSPRATVIFCREIDRLTRDIRRGCLLGGLKDLDIHYIGRVGPAFQAANPKGVYAGPLPFSEVVAYLRRSKVALYDTINLRDSALIRLFYSIQAGCVPASEMNGYLAREFSDGVDVIALNLNDPAGNTERIRSAIADPARAESLAEAARRTCANGHTWAHRIGPLVGAIRN